MPLHVAGTSFEVDDRDPLASAETIDAIAEHYEHTQRLRG